MCSEATRPGRASMTRPGSGRHRNKDQTEPTRDCAASLQPNAHVPFFRQYAYCRLSKNWGEASMIPADEGSLSSQRGENEARDFAIRCRSNSRNSRVATAGTRPAGNTCQHDKLLRWTICRQLNHNYAPSGRKYFGLSECESSPSAYNSERFSKIFH